MKKILGHLAFLAVFVIAPISVQAAGVWSDSFNVVRVILKPDEVALVPDNDAAASCNWGQFRITEGRAGQNAESVQRYATALSASEQIRMSAYAGGLAIYTEPYRAFYYPSDGNCFIERLIVGPLYQY